MHQRLVATLAMALGLTVLAGCGNQQISTSKKNYAADGMVAVIKGTAPSKAQITAQVGQNNSQRVTNHDGNFVYTVAPSAQPQKVVFKAGSSQRTVTVAASQSFGAYTKFAAKYNMILFQMAQQAEAKAKGTSQAEQAAAQKKQQAAIAVMPKAAQAALQAKLQAQANQTPGAFPAAGQEGIHNVLKAQGNTVRTNVQDGQLIGATFMTPVKTLKDKKKAAVFAQQFALLASTLGADAKSIMKDFQKQSKDSQNGQTTMKTIVSNKVRFDVGFSPDTLYIYITR